MRIHNTNPWRSSPMQLLVLLAAVLYFSLVPVASAAAESLAIVGGTVHPVSGDSFVGTVLVEDGVIVQVGADVTVPADATRIDASGLHVYPGFTDALSQVGLLEVSSIPATDDRSEMGTYNPHLEAATAIHPASELIGVTRSTGITQTLVAPTAPRDGVISGRATLIQLDGWTVEEMAIAPSLALVVKWPSIVKRSFDFSTFSYKESPFSDAEDTAKEKQDELRDWLDAARHYRQAMAVEKPRTERDLKLAYLAEFLDRARPVIFQANNERDIEAILDFAAEQGLAPILAGGLDAWKLADRLATEKVPVILGAAQALPREEDDPYDRPFHNASVLVAAGVKIAFGSGATSGWGASVHAARELPFEAETAAAYGLSPDDALKAMTLWPAEILGVDDRLGSLEEGKLANLMVVEGNPLELRSGVRHLIIGGREVSLDDFHRQLYEKYRAR